MTYANSKRRDLIGRATFFCLRKLPVRGVTRPPFPLLAKIRGLARETSAEFTSLSADSETSTVRLHTEGRRYGE